jgi:hypothetical protein
MEFTRTYGLEDTILFDVGARAIKDSRKKMMMMIACAVVEGKRSGVSYVTLPRISYVEAYSSTDFVNTSKNAEFV